MTETKTIVCTFVHNKETYSGAHHYIADTDDYKIGSLYIQKAALCGDVPDKVTATVTYQA